MKANIIIALITAPLFLLCWYLYQQGVECTDSGGVYVRTMTGYECFMVLRK